MYNEINELIFPLSLNQNDPAGNMDNTKKKNLTEKAVLISITFIVIGLFIFFLSDMFIPFVKLELANDMDGAKEYLMSKGVVGYLTVAVVEALQMVVVFISAEFIQITSGMSYPWWLAVILCDCGVMIGSSIIYLLVNVFKFDSGIIGKKTDIEKYERRSKTRSTVILMYLLFIMPIIPFGAICYYGSGKKLPYLRYLFTCATGTIPSIVTSIVMGTAIKEFIAKSLPIWALILIIIFAAAILFTLLALVIKKFFINPNTDKGFFTYLLEKLIIKAALFKVKCRFINKEALDKLDGPFICIADHHSAYDVFPTQKLMEDKNPIFVCNEYYARIPIFGKILLKRGYIIKKKMFYRDMRCIKEIFSNLKNGRPVIIFPEGRLSTDGGPSYFDDGIAHLCEKAGVPVVLLQIRNNYFIKPKWRKARFGGECEAEIKRVISKEEAAATERSELYNMIREVLSYNDFSNDALTYRQPNKAKGLENILYLCPHCKTLYSNVSKGNRLVCTSCGKEYSIKSNYHFDDDSIKNIFEYYGKIKEIERESVGETDLSVPVDVKIFTDGIKKYRVEKGVFTITAAKVSFSSTVSDLYFEYPIQYLDGIAYSVNEEFELYHNNELYYFYPEKHNRKICTRIALIFELLEEKSYEK